MKTLPAVRRSLSVISRRSRFSAAVLLATLAAGFVAGSVSVSAQTSAVPGFLSYQGRVTAANGTLVGAGTPVNRKVTFRIWDGPSGALDSNLIYSETQTATISEGEFSVLIGQGTAVTGSPLGYDEAAKGPALRKLADAVVFGGAARYLGVTVDDGSSTYNVEISPRQQIVTSAFSFRAKFAESLGANGVSSLTALDNGNIGIGTTTPGAKLDVAGTIRATGAGGYGFSSGDADGGIFSPADGTITFNTDATEKMRIASSGWVGIGTTSRTTGTSFLDVNGGIHATNFSFRSPGDADGGLFSAGDGLLGLRTNGVERLRINASGLVGVGTTGPAFALEVRNDTTPEIAVGKLDGTGGALYFGNNAHGVRRNFGGTANDIGFYTTDGKIHLSAAGASAGQFVLTPGGDVGIGTATPGARLHLSATNAAGTHHLHVFPGMLNNTATANAVTFDLPNTPSGTFSFWDNLVVSGNVGVGNTSATQRLHVTGNSLVTGNAYVLDANHYVRATAGSGISLSTYLVTDGLILKQESGNVGIGTTSPQAKLHVEGSVMAGTSGGFVFTNDGDSGMFTTGNDANTLAFRTANVNRLWLTGDGRLGLGTSTPIATLHVSNGVGITNNLEGYLDGAGANGGFIGNFAGTYSIAADHRIRTLSGFDVISDVRLKNVIGRSSGSDDLAVLMRLAVTDYTFKDSVGRAGRVEKKVIAQEVEAVYPQAVHRSTDVVPDLFREASIDAAGWVSLATDLKVGERVRLVTPAGTAVHEVLAVEPGRFRTAFATATARAFVYGREVDDFRAVDYDALAMLNLSATQQLKRDHDAALAALREENAALRLQLAAQDARLAAIERRIQASATAMAKPAAAPANASGQE